MEDLKRIHMLREHASLADILRTRAREQPHQLAFRFLEDGEKEEVTLTHIELERRVLSLAATLQQFARKEDRVLVLFPPGIDFIIAFYACLLAGMTAIPAIPPHPTRPQKHLPVIIRIVKDAKPAVALIHALLRDVIQSRDLDGFERMELIVPGHTARDDHADDWVQPDISDDDIAFLQYTSGSTTIPKGVMVSHQNLIHNMALIEKCFGVTRQSHGVIWLPPYHDMGLIGGILQPLYTGLPVTLLPHMMFLQNPFRWLNAISQHRATVSGGPNFAYDLCVRKIKPDQLELLDLSTWDVAFNGAEPVYHKTLERFAGYFKPCGFRIEAFLPCYGLAESTLMVTGGPKSRPPRVRHLVSDAIKDHRVEVKESPGKDTRTLVSCGMNLNPAQDLRIVDPDTHATCPGGEIGEIWLRGPCVTQGYWNKPEETDRAYHAYLAGSGEGPYLRSGDLGFFDDGELYITGRIKNLIISGGKNHYPHDIERTIQGVHPAIWPAGCAVFSVDHEGPERMVAVIEVKHRLIDDEARMKNSIRRAISDHHGLHVDDIRLTLPGGIPRTTSGKIRHFLCRKQYLDGTLKKISQI